MESGIEHHNPNPLICITKTTIPSEYSNKEVIIYSNYYNYNMYFMHSSCYESIKYLFNGEMDFLKEKKGDNRYISSNYLTLFK